MSVAKVDGAKPKRTAKPQSLHGYVQFDPYKCAETSRERENRVNTNNAAPGKRGERREYTTDAFKLYNRQAIPDELKTQILQELEDEAATESESDEALIRFHPPQTAVAANDNQNGTVINQILNRNVGDSLISHAVAAHDVDTKAFLMWIATTGNHVTILSLLPQNRGHSKYNDRLMKRVTAICQPTNKRPQLRLLINNRQLQLHHLPLKSKKKQRPQLRMTFRIHNRPMPWHQRFQQQRQDVARTHPLRLARGRAIHDGAIKGLFPDDCVACRTHDGGAAVEKQRFQRWKHE